MNTIENRFPIEPAFVRDPEEHVAGDVSLNPTNGPITVVANDIELSESATLYGPWLDFDPEHPNLFVQVQAFIAGLIAVDATTDRGETWRVVAQQVIPADGAHYGEFEPPQGATHFRVRFCTGTLGVEGLTIVAQQVR